MTVTEHAGQRCSSWARQEDVDPVGTAGTYRGLVCVEWPHPWPKDASDAVGLGTVAKELARAGVRLQLLRGDSAGDGRATVLSFRRNDGAFVRFDRHESRVDRSMLADAAIAAGRGELLHRPAQREVDVLICAHGSRDVCCGSSGTRLAAAFAASSTGDLAASSGLEIRVWATSHLGGHRFAPTAVVMPSGTCWAFLDEATLAALVGRSGALDVLLDRYRGCLGIGPSRAQALERVAFREVGWSWLDHERQGREVGGNVVAIDATSPDGRRLEWSGLVTDGRCLPVPMCREPIEAAAKSECELVVAAFRRDR